MMLISAEALLAQLPGYVVFRDLHSTFIASNVNTAKLLGFSSIEALVGLTDYDINYHPEYINFAEEFCKHDQEVIQTEKEMKVLGVFPYADGEIHSVLAFKKPLHDEHHQVTGVIITMNDIKNEYFEKLFSKIIQHDHHFLPKKMRGVQKVILKNFQHGQLTHKESEILYYFIRGASARNIAEILYRSRRTIETHIDSIKNKLGIYKKSELIEFCIENNMLNSIPASLLSNVSHFFLTLDE